jgi:hypothetical protein
MAAKPLLILFCSGEHENVHLGAMIASVAAVSDRPVQGFVSMNAILAFKKAKQGRAKGLKLGPGALPVSYSRRSPKETACRETGKKEFPMLKHDG